MRGGGGSLLTSLLSETIPLDDYYLRKWRAWLAEVYGEDDCGECE